MPCPHTRHLSSARDDHRAHFHIRSYIVIHSLAVYQLHHPEPHVAHPAIQPLTTGAMPSSSRTTPSSSSSSSSSHPNNLHLSPDAYELNPISPRSNPDQDHDPSHEDSDSENERLIGNPHDHSDDASSTQSYELYTPLESSRVLRKLDRRLVSFMALLYMLSFLDRSNIGNARIAGLADDLALSSAQYEWLLWAFYITYIAFEWMTLLYRIVPPHIYIAICIASWGVIASMQATATSFWFLLVLRALLGVSEAAFGPGVPFYLSGFFRREELALRTGLFISASPLSASFAGALAWGITWIGEKGPLSPWRLLFLVEGFPSVLVAVWAWDFVPDGPGTARWLGERERKVAVLRLRQDREDEEEEWEEKGGNGLEGKRGIDLREVWKTLKDPKCYLTAVSMPRFILFSNLYICQTILIDAVHVLLLQRRIRIYARLPPYHHPRHGSHRPRRPSSLRAALPSRFRHRSAYCLSLRPIQIPLRIYHFSFPHRHCRLHDHCALRSFSL